MHIEMYNAKALYVFAHMKLDAEPHVRPMQCYIFTFSPFKYGQ